MTGSHPAPLGLSFHLRSSVDALQVSSKNRKFRRLTQAPYKASSEFRKECVIMRIAKYLKKDVGRRAAFLFLPFFLAFSSAHAKETKTRGVGHVRAGVYFQARPPAGVNDWYAPPRSPGWNDETGS